MSLLRLITFLVLVYKWVLQLEETRHECQENAAAQWLPLKKRRIRRRSLRDCFITASSVCAFPSSEGLEVPLHLSPHISSRAHHPFTFCPYGILLSSARNFWIGWSLRHSLHHIGFFSGLAELGGDIEHFKDALAEETSFKKKKESRNIVRFISVVKRRSCGVFFDS